MIQDSLAKILDAAPEAGNRFFDTRDFKSKKDKTVGYLVITADKGLAGAYNHNVIKLAEKLAENEEKDMLLLSVNSADTILKARVFRLIIILTIPHKILQ